jgi:hypothetical protein
VRGWGHVLMWLGFLAAAFVTTRRADVVQWPLYAAAAAVGLAGVVILRRTGGPSAAQAEVVHGSIAQLEARLTRLVQGLAALNRDRESVFVYDVHTRIDRDLLDDLGSFAEDREAIIHGLGLVPFAAVMDPFARAERQINRAWSASADGYVDEVWACLGRAQEFMSAAEQALKQHRSHP